MMTEAQRITAALDGKWYGRYGAACCPAHGDRKPSLTLADGPSGRLLAHCKSGCDFIAVLNALRGLGIVAGDGAAPQTDPDELARYEAARSREAAKREQQARSVWDNSLPVAGSNAETYLRGRGISCDLPAKLRYLPECWHPSAQHLPAMIAQVEGAERFAVHRTYLNAKGAGKANVSPSKAMLGQVGGGAVRLSEGADALAVAEGLESALSLLCGPLSGSVAVWATLSTSGMSGLRLPGRPGTLIVASDGDAAGQAAGAKLADRASALGLSLIHI